MAHEYAKRCPACGGTEFIATAHVTQTWRVDGDGGFLDQVTACDDVLHRPDDIDIWTCAACGRSGPGSAFNVPEPDRTDGTGADGA